MIIKHTLRKGGVTFQFRKVMLMENNKHLHFLHSWLMSGVLSYDSESTVGCENFSRTAQRTWHRVYQASKHPRFQSNQAVTRCRNKPNPLRLQQSSPQDQRDQSIINTEHHERPGVHASKCQSHFGCTKGNCTILGRCLHSNLLRHVTHTHWDFKRKWNSDSSKQTVCSPLHTASFLCSEKHSANDSAGFHLYVCSLHVVKCAYFFSCNTVINAQRWYSGSFMASFSPLQREYTNRAGCKYVHSLLSLMHFSTQSKVFFFFSASGTIKFVCRNH